MHLRLIQREVAERSLKGLLNSVQHESERLEKVMNESLSFALGVIMAIFSVLLIARANFFLWF